MDAKRDYLSIGNGNCLKGIFAICVFCHHLYQHSGLLHGTIPGKMLQAAGFLSVAVFFFISGYGLSAQYRTKGENYIRLFPYKRILPFYCTYLVAVVLYIVLRLIMGQTISLPSLALTLTYGNTVVANGWYFQVLLLYYILFYFGNRLFRKSPRNGIIFIACCVVFIGGLSWIGHMDSVKYQSTPLLVLGLIYPYCKDRVDAFLCNRKAYTVTVSLASVFLASFLIIGGTSSFHPDLRLAARIVSSVLFVGFVVLIIMKVRINNPVTRLLGRYYLEIYTMHGMAIMLFKWEKASIGNPYLYCVAVIALTAVLSAAVHPVYTFISRKIKSLKWGKIKS